MRPSQISAQIGRVSARMGNPGEADSLEDLKTRLSAAEASIALLVARIVSMTPTILSTAGNETYTGAQLAGGIIRRDPNGGGRTDTTDSAVNIISALGLTADGQTRSCLLVNTADAAEAITLAAGSGVTITNSGQTVEQNESAALLFRRTSASAVTVDILGA